MLFAQVKRLVICQHDLVFAGVDLFAADKVRAKLWVAIDELLAIGHLIDDAVVVRAVNWRGCLGKQDWDVAVLVATHTLLFGGQVHLVVVA